MSTTLSVRLPEALAERIRLAARSVDRKPSYFVQKALERYFEDEFDYQLALTRLLDKNDRTISLEDARKELGI